MKIRILLFLVDIFLLNAAFLLSFFLRYAGNIPKESFQPYKSNCIFLTLIYMSTLFFAGVFKKRFTAFSDLLKKIFVGLSFGTMFGISLIYIFRIIWTTFPSSIFVISFLIALFFIFTFNALILKLTGRIRKKIVLIGKEQNDGILVNGAYTETKQVESIEELIKCKDIDEIIICKKIDGEKNFNLLLYLLQKLNISVFFLPNLYVELLSQSLNGNTRARFLATFLGKKSDTEEFLIRALDIVVSLVILIVVAPFVPLIALLIEISSPGPVFYKQQRAGKDGKAFTLYKFRTMVKDAGLNPATEDDPRVTKVGRFFRRARLDELPQLINVLRGQMSLVGPRPENFARIEIHKALQGIRLAVKPGLTGLAQVRSYYDLRPKNKIKYDYLYIQKRSLQLNLYILWKTVPVLLSKKGW